MPNWMDMIPMLAQIGGQAGAALSAQGGNQMGVALGNLASQMGQNAAYAFPQGYSKALGQAAASQPVVQTPGMNPSAAESLIERQKLTPQTAASMMGTAPSSTGANLSPLAAMMMSPEQQNAMSKMQMERQSLELAKQAQPSEISYRNSLRRQAEAQTTATNMNTFGISPMERAKLGLQALSLKLSEQAQTAQAANDAPKTKLLWQEYERTNNINKTINALQTAQEPGQKVRLMEELLLLDPSRATALMKDQAKIDPIFKMVWETAEGIMKANEQFAPGKSDPKVAATKAIETLKEIGNALNGNQQTGAQQQQQKKIPLYDESVGDFVQ